MSVVGSRPSSMEGSRAIRRVLNVRLKDPQSALRVAGTLGIFLFTVLQAFRLAKATKGVDTTAKRRRHDGRGYRTGDESTAASI